VPLIFPDGAPEPLGIAVSNFETTNKFSEEVRFAAKRMAGSSGSWWFLHQRVGRCCSERRHECRVDGQVRGAPELYTTFSPGHYIEWAMFGSATEHFTDQFDVQIGAAIAGRRNITSWMSAECSARRPRVPTRIPRLMRSLIP